MAAASLIPLLGKGANITARIAMAASPATA